MQRIVLICAQNTIHIIRKNVKQIGVKFIIIPSFSDHTTYTKKCLKKKGFTGRDVSFQSDRNLWAL